MTVEQHIVEQPLNKQLLNKSFLNRHGWGRRGGPAGWARAGRQASGWAAGGMGGIKIYSVATLKGPFPPALPEDRKHMACLCAHGHVTPAPLNHQNVPWSTVRRLSDFRRASRRGHGAPVRHQGSFRVTTQCTWWSGKGPDERLGSSREAARAPGVITESARWDRKGTG